MQNMGREFNRYSGASGSTQDDVKSLFIKQLRNYGYSEHQQDGTNYWKHTFFKGEIWQSPEDIDYLGSATSHHWIIYCGAF